MTPLRRRMLDEMELRNFTDDTKKNYVNAVSQLARYFDKCPSKINQEELRRYLLHLRTERRVANSTYTFHLCALRFFYTHTLKRRTFVETIPFPKGESKLPVVLSREEVSRFLGALHCL